MDTTLLRCLGVLLIINSHLEAYYPHAWMAGDGVLGNTLFFSVSGFSLAIAQSRRPRPPGSWLWRRAHRLYPSLWIVLGIGWLGFEQSWRTWRPIDYPLNFFWPTPYTFILGIVPSYLLFLPLAQINRARPYLLTAAACAVPYGAFYLYGLPSGLNVWIGPLHVRGWMEIIECLAAMFLGAWYAKRVLEGAAPISSLANTALLAAAAAVYLVVKVLVNVEHRFAALYFVQHLSALLIMLSLYRLFSSAGVWQIIARDRRVRRMSDASLEIYFVHVLLIDTVLRKWACPLNVLSLLLISVVLGVVLRAATKALMQFVAGSRAIAK